LKLFFVIFLLSQRLPSFLPVGNAAFSANLPIRDLSFKEPCGGGWIRILPPWLDSARQEGQQGFSPGASPLFRQAANVPCDFIVITNGQHDIADWSKFDPGWQMKLAGWLNEKLGPRFP